jgi:hypothetical protein
MTQYQGNVLSFYFRIFSSSHLPNFSPTHLLIFSRA